jgi:hypothetical protein
LLPSEQAGSADGRASLSEKLRAIGQHKAADLAGFLELMSEPESVELSRQAKALTSDQG